MGVAYQGALSPTPWERRPTRLHLDQSGNRRISVGNVHQRCSDDGGPNKSTVGQAEGEIDGGKPGETMLTSKQEAFCQAIVDGLNQSDAYRTAYDASNMKPNVIHQKAYEVMNHGDVAVRIASLRQAVTDKLTTKRIWDAERFIEESETNLRLGRFLGQVAPANGALQLIGRTAGLLDSQPQAAMQITKVTVVLNPGTEGGGGGPGPGIVDVGTEPSS